MVSLIEELEAREAAARARVEELKAEIGGHAVRAGAQTVVGRPAARVIWSQMVKRMVISAR
ncbi:hypothetical protein [Streptomyces tibetensis]|uniref:hypothetical protein n=1 Tax=Streptomyces tibetensis TaxID=2382123 RepID=UPI0033F41420